LDLVENEIGPYPKFGFLKIKFLKIKDPSKRDKLIAEYIKTKNKIQNDFRSERLCEQSMYEDFGKIFKPKLNNNKRHLKKLFPSSLHFKKQ